METWRRTAGGLAALAAAVLTSACAGLSPDAVRGYENGRRRPRREHLLGVLNAVELSHHDMNRALRQAGFAEIESLFPVDDRPSFYFSVDELDAAVETVPWPQFVVNNTLEVMAANRAMQAVWDVDFEVERRSRTRAARRAHRTPAAARPPMRPRGRW